MRGSDASSRAEGGPLIHLFGHVDKMRSSHLVAHDVRIRSPRSGAEKVGRPYHPFGHFGPRG